MDRCRGTSMLGRMRGRVAVIVALAVALPAMLGAAEPAAELPPRDSVAGVVARLLINETPFPGERGWVSEEDTRGAMLAILWVLESRLRHVPAGYKQEHIAAERCDDIIDVITAGGEKGQCDGFFRDSSGRPMAVDRVHERIDHLLACANRGSPGRFARLLNYGAGLAETYVKKGMEEADRFAGLERIGEVAVTGRAYSWMTDVDGYHPGGNFVRIPDGQSGAMGGNRFFTLRRLR